VQKKSNLRTLKKRGELTNKMNAKTNNKTAVACHFENKDPEVREIYDRILKASRKFGAVGEDPKKTSIHLNRKSAFAGIATRKNAIILTIKSDRKLTSPRVHKSEQTSASRFHLEVKLNSSTEVDSELIEWLKRAYELSD
jgi:Domain of unknown function (DUF5655)